MSLPKSNHSLLQYDRLLTAKFLIWNVRHKETYLLRLLGVTPERIASFHDMDVNEVIRELHEAESDILRNFETLIDTAMEKGCLPPALSNVARPKNILKRIDSIIARIPGSLLESHRSFKSHETVLKAAESLNISHEEMSKRLRRIYTYFRRRMKAILGQLFGVGEKSFEPFPELGELVDNVKSIRNSILESEPARGLSKPKKQFAESALDHLCEMNRIYGNCKMVFEYHAVGYSTWEIAAMLGMPANHVQNIFTEIRRYFRDRMTKLAVNFMKGEDGDDPLHCRNDRLVAECALRILSTSRFEVLALQEKGMSAEEIAEAVKMPIPDVKNSLQKTKRDLGSYAMRLAVVYVRRGEKVGEARERIRTLSKHIMAVQSLTNDIVLPQEKETLFSLTDAEHFEISLAFMELDKHVMDVFILHYFLDLRIQQIADRLCTSLEDIEKREEYATAFLEERFVRMMATLFMMKNSHPNIPQVSQTEIVSAQILSGLASSSYGDIIREYVLNDFIADFSRSPDKTVEHLSCRASFRFFLLCKFKTWLWTEVNGRIFADDFLQRLRLDITLCRFPSNTSFAHEAMFSLERAEIRLAIKNMSFDIRETFILRFGIGLHPSKVASIQGIDVAEVLHRIDSAVQSLCRHVEDLLRKLFRQYTHPLEVLPLDIRQYHCAKTVLDAIPGENREIYIRHKIRGESSSEVAAALRLPTQKTNELIAECLSTIEKQTISQAVTTMRYRDEDRPIGDALLDGPERKHFSSTLWDEVC